MNSEDKNNYNSRLEILLRSYHRNSYLNKEEILTHFPENKITKEEFVTKIKELSVPEFKKFPRINKPDFSNMSPEKIDFGALKKLNPENWDEIDKKILFVSLLFWSLVYIFIFILFY
ncbi:MAG: hypothetical protein H7A24_06945 [Leptospiraceae bacterium]|nr:hypothetical protein [Leptospiraceae bacterium]MCP5511600.1 hypothetical protein [Leptospiraceae bacterium]